MEPGVREAIFGKKPNKDDVKRQDDVLRLFCDDCSKTFSTPHGKRVFWFLMEASKVFSPLPDHGVWNQRAEGMRVIGLLLLSGIGFGHDFGHLAGLNREYRNYKSEEKGDD